MKVENIFDVQNMIEMRNIIDTWNMIEKFNLQGCAIKDSTVILLPVAEYERLLASVKNKNYIRGLVRSEVLAMYEQSLLCGIMNDWYGSMEDLFQDLKHYGFEVLESNRESITVSCDDDGDYVQIELALGGTERTIVVEDFEEIYREEA